MTELQAACLAVAQSAIDGEVYVGPEDEYEFSINHSAPVEGDGATVTAICTDSGNRYRVVLQAFEIPQ